ncbi:lipoprotein [Vibrio metoecus]|nr:lipoprotein [Vibrio metoecus]
MVQYMQFPRRRLVLTITSLLLVGCANLTAGNLFSHYSAQNNGLYQSVAAGQYEQASQLLPEYVAGEVLDNLEKGRVYFLSQQYLESQQSLSIADNAVKAQQDRAIISLSSTATSVGALAVNDNLNEYEPADYELGFLHLYLGLNYVRNNDLDGALVEMRRANQVQEAAKKRREQELTSAEQDMRSQGLSPSLGSVLAQYPDAGKTLQAVQNGYLLYLSALLYEADNDLNSAYVDYRRALAVAPNNPAVIDGTLRVATRLSMQQDLKLLKQQYGEPQRLSASQARVIVIEEQGIVQPKQAWRLSLPLSDSRGNTALYSLALPYYEQSVMPQRATFSLNGVSVQPAPVTDVNLMARQALTEQMPALVLRQALRVVAKDQLRKETTKEEDVANLVFNIWNTLTEQPDTRSWLTLPAAVNTATQLVKAGEQVLDIAGTHYTFHVPENGTALVWLSRQSNSVTIWHKQLGIR